MFFLTRAASDSTERRTYRAKFPFLGDSMLGRLVGKTKAREELPLLNDRDFLLVGFNELDLLDLQGQMRDLGVASIAVANDVKKLQNWPRGRKSFGGVVVNLDAFSDLDDALDCLIDFRIKSPGTIIILVSYFTGGDDFGSERRILCDVTLRAPVSVRRLEIALRQGLANAMAAANGADSPIQMPWEKESPKERQIVSRAPNGAKDGMEKGADWAAVRKPVHEQVSRTREDLENDRDAGWLGALFLSSALGLSCAVFAWLNDFSFLGSVAVFYGTSLSILVSLLLLRLLAK